MHSEVSQSVVNSHISTWNGVTAAGSVREMPSLQMAIVVLSEVLFTIPFEILYEFLSSEVVGVEIKITINDKDLHVSLLKDLAHNVFWLRLRNLGVSSFI